MIDACVTHALHIKRDQQFDSVESRNDQHDVVICHYSGHILIDAVVDDDDDDDGDGLCFISHANSAGRTIKFQCMTLKHCHRMYLACVCVMEYVHIYAGFRDEWICECVY